MGVIVALVARFSDGFYGYPRKTPEMV